MDRQEQNYRQRSSPSSPQAGIDSLQILIDIDVSGFNVECFVRLMIAFDERAWEEVY